MWREVPEEVVGFAVEKPDLGGLGFKKIVLLTYPKKND